MNTSAEARVVASFTFITALLLGAWTPLDAWLERIFQGDLLGSLIVTLVPFVATGIAHQAARTAEAAWARVLGGAAVMLGGLTCVGAVLYLSVNA